MVPEPQVQGTWRFSGEHPLFDEHFPGAPRVPGTLVIEAIRAGAGSLPRLASPWA